MRILTIFWREYWSNITRRSYLIFTFGFPLFVIALPVVGGIALALVLQTLLPATDPRPIGLIDQAALLSPANRPNNPVDIVFFDNPAIAAQSLADGDIQAYYHIPSDYWQSGQVIITYQTAPASQVDKMVTNWLEAEIRGKIPSSVLARVDAGPIITHQGISGESAAFAENNLLESIMVVVIIYFVRLAGSFTASYMFDTIANESQDRTLEILITTVTPLQLVAGKFLGLLAVGLTQLGMWLGALLILTLGAGYFFGVNLLSYLLGWEHLGLMLSALAATYILDHILAAGMGLKRISSGSGHLLFNSANMLMTVILLYAFYFLPRNPDTFLAVAASLFPLTAAVVLLIRIVTSEVPLWQVILSQLLMWGTVIGGVFWLRRLLEANLVAHAEPMTWPVLFKNGIAGLKRLVIRAK
ncbi:MAG: ABC transporter permease [Anaerolineaceae bacterium]|nr:ABC transporter permease [Anaerolineaceae bacterium]MCB9097970.1 ABC transporter permease [Anaerolineales bacterium]